MHWFPDYHPMERHFIRAENQLKLKVMFTVAAIYGFLIGFPVLLAPAAMAAMSGISVPSAALMVYRFMGVANIGLGVVAWLVRNSEASTARAGVSLGLFTFFALHALASVYAQFTEPAIATSWIYAIVQAVIALGFFMARKANMSTGKQ